MSKLRSGGRLTMVGQRRADLASPDCAMGPCSLSHPPHTPRIALVWVEVGQNGAEYGFGWRGMRQCTCDLIWRVTLHGTVGMSDSATAGDTRRGSHCTRSALRLCGRYVPETVFTLVTRGCLFGVKI